MMQVYITSVSSLIFLSIVFAASIRKSAADCDGKAGFNTVPPIGNWESSGSFPFVNSKIIVYILLLRFEH